MPHPYLTNIYDIDPTFENPKDIKQMLMSLLEQYPDKYFWEAGLEYRFQEGDNYRTVLRFTHHLLKRQRTNTKDRTGIRYECIEPAQIASGGTGAIFNSAGTLDETGTFKNTKQRLVKIEKWNSNMPVLSEIHPKFTNEKWNALISLTHMKQAVFYKNNMYTVMRKMPGKELFQIINEDLSPDSRLTTQQRIKLTLELLYAFKEQIIAIKLIHGDIKPENIIVDLSSEMPAVRFIDFDNSCLLIDAPNRMEEQSGTFVYFSPELVNCHCLPTQESDMYAMGRVIAMLWGNSTDSYNSDTLYASYVQNPHLNDLFHRLEDEQSSISNYIKNTVKNALLLMHSPEPTKRPSIEEVIERFSLIDTQVKLSDFIHIEEKYSLRTMSVPQKIDLSQELLQSLYRQYAKNGQLHGALSPEAFTVNLTSETIKVQITPIAANIRCTRPYNYQAKELFFTSGAVRTPACDVYAIARVIARLWGDNPQSHNQTDIDFAQQYAENPRIDLNNCHMPSALSDHNLTIITEALSLMLEPDIRARISLSKAITYFSRLERENQREYREPDVIAQITPSNPL